MYVFAALIGGCMAVDLENISNEDRNFKALGIKKIKKRKEELLRFIESNKDKKWIICSHNNPDPDSMSSAFGLQWVLQSLGVDSVEIYYCGEISHPQNKTMVNELNIPLKKWNMQVESDIESQRDNYVFVSVDCVGNQKNISIPMKMDVSIDHHKSNAGKDTLFVHDEIGSCATLIVDIGLSVAPDKETNNDDDDSNSENGHVNNGCFDPNEPGIKEVATALALGIKTDTLDFRSESTTEHDFKAYKFLSSMLSDDKFQKIVNYELPAYVFDAETLAWNNKNESYTPNFISGLKYIDPIKSDCIPHLADKFMRAPGVQTVVIYAIVGNAVRGSVRTLSSSVDAQQICDNLFGVGNGGAKHRSGGATVTFNVFDPTTLDDSDKDMLWTLVKSQIELRFKNLMDQ